MADVAVNVNPPTVTLSPEAKGLNVIVEAVEVEATPAVLVGAVAAVIVLAVTTSAVFPAVVDVKFTILLDTAPDLKPVNVPENV